MAFNKRIMKKLEEACDGNEAMLGYMRDIVTLEMREVKQYKTDYSKCLKRRSREELEGGGN